MNSPQVDSHPHRGLRTLLPPFMTGRRREDSRTHAPPPAGTVSHGSGMSRPTYLPGGVLLALLLAAVMLAAGVGLYALAQPAAFKAFDIVAGLELESEVADTWVIRGRVLRDHAPAPGVRVWAVMKDQRGNRTSPAVAYTDEQGSYALGPFVMKIGPYPVTEVSLHTWAPLPPGIFNWFRGAQGATGEEVLIVGQGSLRRVKFSSWGLIVPAGIFVASMTVAFLGEGARWAYKLAMASAFILTGVMILAISAGLSYVHSTGEKNEILSLGFASLFRGQYVEPAEPEWLFSLTAPRALPNRPTEAPAQRANPPDAKAKAAGAAAPPGGEAGRDRPTPGTLPPANALAPAMDATAGSPERPDPPLVRGFGAPLWVLLLAVIGVGLRTMSIIVNEISHEPNFTDQQAVRCRIELIVRHQFFMLFAPLGAIFVYQFLVMAESASQPSTVALVSLGAGLTLTTLIERALATATQYAGGPGDAAGQPEARVELKETVIAEKTLSVQEPVAPEPAAQGAGAAGSAPQSPAPGATAPTGEGDRTLATPASASGRTNGAS